MSIRLRLTLWYSGLLAAVLIGFGLLIYSVVYNSTMSDIRGELAKLSANMRVQGKFINGGLDLNAQAPQGFDANIYGIQLVNYTQDKSGKSIDKSNNLIRTNITFPVPDFSKVDPQAKGRFFSNTLGGTRFLIYETPLLTLDGNLVGMLQVGAYTEREESLFSFLRSILIFAGLFSIAAAFSLGMLVSRKALRPIGRVTEAAEQIQSGSELGLRIPRDTPNDEIGRLTDTLNGMLARLEVAYNHLEESNTAQRRFVSDASHELRTPLTTIRGNVDLLEKIWTLPPEGSDGHAAHKLPEAERKIMSLEAISDIADEARRMSRLVNDLLSLARADAGYAMEMQTLSLRPLAEEAARRASFLPRQADWIVGPFEALDGVWVTGNKDYLLQLLFILIENGFKYTPSGQVRLYASRSGNRVGLTVSDTGIGLAAEDLPHIFDRFYRADQSRGQTSGTGLGLSIAKWIADMHKAKLEVKSRMEEGTSFTLWLPTLDPRTVDFSQPGEYGIMEPSERPAFSNSELREGQD